MAKGRKTGGRNFKPGVVTNPHGRPPASPELKAIRKMTRLEVEQRIIELWDKNESELHKLVNDSETTIRDKTIMRVMLRAIAKGDYSALGFIMDLIFGKRIERMEIQVNPYLGKSVQELEALVKAKLKEK